MNKKFLGIMFVLAGVLIFAGAGCGDKSVTDAEKQTNTNPTDLCDSTKEAPSSNDMANEIKLILNEAGAEVKLTSDFQKDSPNEGLLVYVWEKKPTAEKIENAFRKHGYQTEISGGSLIATKINTILNISWIEEMNCKKINVMVINKTSKQKGSVTIKECAKLKVLALRADVRNHDPATATINSSILFQYWDTLAVKYNTTRDAVSKTCEAKVDEPGFNEEVEKQERELNSMTE